MYSSNYIKNLNSAIKHSFPHLKTVESDYKLGLSGISRLVMLDRYSQKDLALKTLQAEDLVIVIVKENKWFPIRAIGHIVSVNHKTRKALVKIESEYLGSLASDDLVAGSNNLIIVSLKLVEKPLEIYYEQIAFRVAANLADQERNDADKEKWQNIFYRQIRDQKIVPAGRVLYGAGSSSRVTFFNCFVMPMYRDSREGIANHRREVMEIMSHGGGVGSNGSTLRPKGALAKTVGGRSSGAVSWLNDLSGLTHLVEQGGSRRGAQMIMLADWHPDIVEFIISKMQNPRILVWLLNNSKNELILKHVKNKITFVPLSETDRSIYEGILANPADFNQKAIDEAKEKLSKGGKWEVNNSDFLSGANISVTLTNEFMHAVENDDIWELKFPDVDNYDAAEKEMYEKHWSKVGDVREWEKQGHSIKLYNTIKARELWDLITFCANYSAEPGIFFMDRANEMTNAAAYDMQVVATNPCGEQPLAPYSVCNLAAINLSQFVNRKTKEILYDDLAESVKICTRLQDNVIDATYYFFEANEKQALGERRNGLGVMGLHDMLIWAGYRYGSKEGNEIIDKVFHAIATAAYIASSNIAVEKGSFPFLQTREKFINTGYMKTMDEDVRKLILKQGIRNSHLLTIAPTGSTGTMINVSTGLEPYFAFKYYRSGRLGKFIEVNAPIVDEWLALNPGYNKDNLPDIFVSAQGLTPEEHVDVQCIIQRWIDSSISKTVNAPKGYTVKEVQKIYETLFKKGAKGGTVYVDGSRDAQVLSLSSAEESEQAAITSIANELLETQDEDISEIASLRGIKQDLKIGTNVGDVCPMCQEGTFVNSGGCATCSNCNVQMKCGL